MTEETELEHVTEDETYAPRVSPAARCLIIGAALLSTAACVVVLIVAVL